MPTAMLAPTLALLIRHGLTAAGMLGLVTGTQIEALAGGLAVAVGLGWSLYQKKKTVAK